MKVLVTGGAGFIGSHVVDLLLAEGAQVRVLDRPDPSGDGAIASRLDPRAELVEADICDRAAVAHAVTGVDAVSHQAAKVGLGVDFGDVTGYVAANDLGTAVLLEALWRRSFRGRLVLASSMVVYGEGLARCPQHGLVTPGARRPDQMASGHFDSPCPQPGCPHSVTWVAVDEDAALCPQNVYGATKLHQEQLCGLWGRDAGAVMVALRYHNVYGPGMPRDTPYAGVASIFRSALAAGRAPLVYEDGGQVRDFVHVGDVARANVLSLTGEAVASGAYNIGSGTPHTVAALAGALADAAGPDAPRPHLTGEWRMGDVRHIVASSDKAAAGLGFTAEMRFEEGMAEFAHAPVRAAAEL